MGSLIKPYLSDNDMLYYTEDFLEKLNQFKFKADHKLVSFYVQSLFTNVPLESLDETIQIAADFIYSDDNRSKHKSLPIKKKFL